MPELPEVETIKRGLEKKIIGKTIDNVEVRAEKLFQGDKESVIGSKIISIKRFAKMIAINLSGDKSLLIHLKMTGQLIFRGKGYGVGGKEKDTPNTLRSTPDSFAGGHPSVDWVADLPNKFTHIIFYFADSSVLYFNDLRKFGYVKVYDTEGLLSNKELKDLGPDPFDEKLSPEYLMRIISKRPKIKIKQIIMDQTVIAGVGNIYADESLFCAKISPLRPAAMVARSELVTLIGCIRKILEKALEYGGSSENTYVNVEGGKGQMQNHFKIYRKTGQKCPNSCGLVKRTVVGGRGTHYCPICQT